MGVEIIADGILVWEEDPSVHDNQLREVLEWEHKRNIKMNKDKCKIRISQMDCVGYTLTPEGVKPDPAQKEAIHKMDQPEEN